jgi:hypothetical protein
VLSLEDRELPGDIFLGLLLGAPLLGASQAAWLAETGTVVSPLPPPSDIAPHLLGATQQTEVTFRAEVVALTATPEEAASGTSGTAPTFAEEPGVFSYTNPPVVSHFVRNT